MIGFTDIGKINHHLSAYEKYLDEGLGDKEQTIPLVSSMLVLMVKGLFSSFEFPYTELLSSSVTSAAVMQNMGSHQSPRDKWISGSGAYM